MFERATVFSAIFVFLVFGKMALKYLNYMEAKNQPTPASITSSK